ncbi:metallophosphoesterase [Fibrisoma limi BUZ 3]|uniref:Metallophosphoesterase n=1 Tax=Fibrisoma limi BUZ 3 TaxID=1185876 RepID=I2GE42_9BACT|nr:metallophosphoesterase [Fibrisoma limi]CCH52167.1 metallophosphoesterase [Fibrisoma limi BUZ 3]
MKLVTISDIHGRGNWVHVNVADYDRVIFLGDYVDSHSLSDGVILNNFHQIIELRQRYPEKIVLLIGNHDAQYLHFPDYSCSGFRAAMQPTLTDLFRNHEDSFQLAYQEGNYLFTHAGVTNGWMNSAKRQVDDAEILALLNNPETVADGLNRLHQSPDFQSILFEVAPVRGGDDPFSGPVWADRSETLTDHLTGFHQVVGHTPISDFRTVGDETSSITYTDVLQTKTAFYNLDL